MGIQDAGWKNKKLPYKPSECPAKLDSWMDGFVGGGCDGKSRKPGKFLDVNQIVRMRRSWMSDFVGGECDGKWLE